MDVAKKRRGNFTTAHKGKKSGKGRDIKRIRVPKFLLRLVFTLYAKGLEPLEISQESGVDLRLTQSILARNHLRTEGDRIKEVERREPNLLISGTLR